MNDGYYKHEASLFPARTDGLIKVCYFVRYKGYKYVKVMDVNPELVNDPDMVKLVEGIAMKEAEKEYDNMVQTIQARRD